MEIMKVLERRLISRLQDQVYPFTAEEIRAENERGWTIETPAPLGNWTRHTDVHFSAAALDRIIRDVRGGETS